MSRLRSAILGLSAAGVAFMCWSLLTDLGELQNAGLDVVEAFNTLAQSYQVLIFMVLALAIIVLGLSYVVYSLSKRITNLEELAARKRQARKQQ